MNPLPDSLARLGELPPLPGLLVAYAPRAEQPWQRLCWLFDQRLASVVRRPGDATIKAIRLAWWDEALVQDDRAKGGGEPLIEAWRTLAPPGSAAHAERLIDGWRVLLAADPLQAADLAAYGAARGGGLFGLIAREASDALGAAGARWALWDLAGHAGTPALAQAAMDQARGTTATAPLPRALKPLRLLHDLAARDIAAGRAPTAAFEARHYRRLLWRALIG